jgi:hypothetical protein
MEVGLNFGSSIMPGITSWGGLSVTRVNRLTIEIAEGPQYLVTDELVRCLPLSPIASVLAAGVLDGPATVVAAVLDAFPRLRDSVTEIIVDDTVVDFMDALFSTGGGRVGPGGWSAPQVRSLTVTPDSNAYSGHLVLGSLAPMSTSNLYPLFLKADDRLCLAFPILKVLSFDRFGYINEPHPSILCSAQYKRVGAYFKIVRFEDPVSVECEI